ncbi:hypothetical protein LOK49_LG02G01830 [Camellia lanceoleosa]|uniref:Uncharacterized protein n=1 Tax=Camellia lanceoleosa TaxID=1840588 RepID=A0ACC0IP91_9ERIC|nr:hypothetical protein LOK49_LG02G01830 [Camellia lanceoleosa]
MAEEMTMGRRPAKFPRLSSIVPFNLKNRSKLNEITSQLQEVANCKVLMEKSPYSLLPPLPIFAHFCKVLHSQSELDGGAS